MARTIAADPLIVHRRKVKPSAPRILGRDLANTMLPGGMRPHAPLALLVSRRRFWFYTGGTYVVGFAPGMASPRQFVNPAYTLYLLQCSTLVECALYHTRRGACTPRRCTSSLPCPDIGPDRRAHITTTAIGERPSLFLCTIFWSLFAGIVITCPGLHPLSLPVLLPPAVTISLLLLSSPDIDRVCWFPLINTSPGGLLPAAVTHPEAVA
ncbi:UbiA prenyltransferase family protein [Methanofollis fontis]|uniref:Uncharacterized protein n=1 Tax=Methanofollis fontis TaxID=2052832 RepID=A0A483CXM0_9EURY|nr:hypothetical protein [Methanofollis fontis]TAJ44679.1 hypothetical protein CUJ86_05075 [Methanofollis fontis]